MYCMNCGKKINNGVKFCRSCGSTVHQTAPVQPLCADKAKPVKAKKKHPVLVFMLIVLLVLGGINFVNTYRKVKENKRPSLKTYDYESFSIELPEDMEKGRNFNELGNGTVYFNQFVHKNEKSLSAEEYAEEVYKKMINERSCSDVTLKGSTIKCCRKDIAGIKYYEINELYVTDDEVILLVVGGNKSDESYFEELLDTVKIK